MPDLNESAAEAAFEQQFGIVTPEQQEPTPAQQVAAEPRPEDVPPEVEDAAAPVDEQQGEEAAAAPELSIDIEVDGKPETVSGNERVRELVSRGLKAGRAMEENARVREALVAHAQQAQFAQQFQAAVFNDVTELQSLNAQLEHYNKVDWNAAFDGNAFEALKLKEQRDQLRERRDAKQREIDSKAQQFKAANEEGSRRLLAAETQALLSKMPEWRNSEKAAAGQREIKQVLASVYGFNQVEIETLMDHRLVIAARDLAEYQKLKAGAAAKSKQVREAPPVVRPGAKPSPTQSGKAEYAKFQQQVRSAASKGQTRVQEELVTQRLNRAFKI